MAISLVRLVDDEIDVSFVVLHVEETDPQELFIQLLEAMPMRVLHRREAAISFYQKEVETYPKRLEDWKVSKEINEAYEKALEEYNLLVEQADEYKMKYGDIPPDVVEPVPPGPEHYPLPPEPLEPKEPQYTEFQGTFAECVSEIQTSDVEELGMKLVQKHDNLQLLEIRPTPQS